MCVELTSPFLRPTVGQPEPSPRHIDDLSARITALRAEDASEDRKQLLAKYRELADREWLAVVQDDVVAEIDRRKKLSALKRVLKDTSTNRITIKSGEIAERLVTNALRAQFSKEINKLKVAGWRSNSGRKRGVMVSLTFELA